MMGFPSKQQIKDAWAVYQQQKLAAEGLAQGQNLTARIALARIDALEQFISVFIPK